MEGYMGTAEAAAYLGVSKSEVFRLIRADLLKAERIGAAYAIAVSELEHRKATNPGPGKPKARR